MKSLLRPILCGGILTALLCTPSLAADEGDFSLLVNGKPVTFSDTAPVLKDGRSFLPMAATFEALGFPADQITWDGEARTVTAVKPDVTYTSFQGTEKQGDLTVKLAIGSNTFSVQYEGNTTAGPHGDPVQVVSSCGSISAVAELNPSCHPGVVRFYHGNPQADVNELIPEEYLDPVSGFPGFKSWFCEVKRYA